MIIKDQLGLASFWELRQCRESLRLEPGAMERVNRCHDFLKQKVMDSSAAIYGVNTGFGALCETRINNSELEALQINLLRSHACGAGSEMPLPLVKTMILLKIISLSKGYSGVSTQLLERLLYFYNSDIIPQVFEQGSLGASGDLAPLAHLSLPLLAEGRVYMGGKLQDAAVLGERISLGPKEGLALINGTQFMLSYALHASFEAHRLLELADLTGSLSLDVYNGRMEPFLAASHAIRPHPGQVQSAANIAKYLSGSEMQSGAGKSVQDPYSFRCMPQVHGASRDAAASCEIVFERELNSVTDNPNVFPESDQVLSAGNFHGQPLALHLDFLGMALAELGSISERRAYQLLSGKHNLPPFLAENAGLESGMMILQYTAASVASQNKQLSMPCSTDSQMSSNGQEDHVSMGANSATKLWRIIDNCYTILAIELLMAGRAMEFRRPLKSSRYLEHFYSQFRSEVPHLNGDQIWSEQITRGIQFLRHCALPAE